MSHLNWTTHMKRSAIALLTLLAACSQAPAPPVVADAPAAPEAAASPPAPWKPLPYEADKPVLKVNDTTRFFSEFVAVVGKAEKGEFETTKDFNARVAKADEVMPPFSTTQDYAFLADTGPGMIYNADKQAYEYSYQFSCELDHPIEGGISCNVGSVTDSKGRYDAQNGFGAQTTVNSQVGREFYLVFTPADAKRNLRRNSANWHEIPVPCPVPLAKAKSLKGKNVQGALVVAIRKAEVMKGYGRVEEPTVDKPERQRYEAIGIPATLRRSFCYAEETGEVLHVNQFH